MVAFIGSAALEATLMYNFAMQHRKLAGPSWIRGSVGSGSSAGLWQPWY
jgi:hypothetical protein